ncbi:MAG: DUF2269 family protein [Candidatus Latescibacterota bacterium]|nr:MAG: DUF2269 family protein [Candidatus Latescibacterota bacterium]
MHDRFQSIILWALVLVIAPAASAHAVTDLPETSRYLLLLLHVFGMILLFGNIAVSSLWMTQARKTGDRAILFYATKTVFRADLLFTLPGLILVIGPGVFLVGGVEDWARASWAELSLALVAVVAFVWLTQVVRYQRKMLHVTKEAAELRIGLSEAFYYYERRWSLWSALVTVLLLASLYLMVFKPHLWGPAV